MSFFAEEITTGFEPIRGDGKSRVGYGLPSVMVGVKKVRQEYTPTETAAFELFKALGNYPEFTKEHRQNLQNEFFNMENLEFMNMESLAAVLSFLHSYPNYKPANFKNKTILGYFKNILPLNFGKLTKKEQKILHVRYKAQFLKYIRSINVFREN